MILPFRLVGFPSAAGTFSSGPSGAFRTFEGCLEVEDAADWTDVPGTWDAWTQWNSDPGDLFVYTYRQIDVGIVYDFEVEVETQGEGARLIEVDWSEDGVTWAGWANYDSLRDRTLRARYFRVRVTVSGSGSQVLTLCRLVVLLRAETVEETLDDVDTAGLPASRRFGPGDVRLPIQTDFAIVRSVSLTFNGTGAGWTWEIIDRDSSVGPRVRIYDPSGELADALVDAVVRGL